MPLLRLLLAGLIALAAMLAVFFAAVVVVVTGLVAWVVQLFRPRPRSGPSQSPARGPSGRTDEVIDVVATDVPDKPAER